MNQEVWIKDMIGDVLEPEGFCYLEDERVEEEDVTVFYFLRKVKNSKEEIIRQMVSIQQHAYSGIIYLNLRSSAAGHRTYRKDDFIPGCNWDSFSFKTEEEYKEIINQIARILLEYGLPFLEKIKEPIISDYFTDEEKEMLYYEHEKLLENILTRENITVEQFDVEEVADYIEKKVEEVKGKPFEEVRTLLLELSALFGAVVAQFHPCHWTLNEFVALSCDLEFSESKMKKTGWESISILPDLWIGWKPKEPSMLRPKNSEGIKECLLKQYMYCIL